MLTRVRPFTTLPCWLQAEVGCMGLAAIVWRFGEIAVGLSTGATDFRQVYMAGLAWRLGLAPYGVVQTSALAAQGLDARPFGMYFYPPACGMLAAPLTYVHYRQACVIWGVAIWTVALAGVLAFSRAVLPRWPIHLHLLGAGIASLACSVRWTLALLQPSLLTVGLLLLFAVAAMRGRWSAATAIGALVATKPTYVLPVVVLLAFRGRFRNLAALAGLLVALNLASSMRTGVEGTWVGYWRALAQVDVVNDPDALGALTPYLVANPRSRLARESGWTPQAKYPGDLRVDVSCIATAWHRAAWSAGAGAALFGLLVACQTVWLWRRTTGTKLRETPEFQSLLFAASTCAALLACYHRRYDAIAVVPTAYVLLAAALRRRPRPMTWLGLGAALLLAYGLTFRMVQAWEMVVVVRSGLLPLAPVCGYLALVVYGSVCVELWRFVRPAEGRADGAAPS